MTWSDTPVPAREGGEEETDDRLGLRDDGAEPVRVGPHELVRVGAGRQGGDEDVGVGRRRDRPSSGGHDELVLDVEELPSAPFRGLPAGRVGVESDDDASGEVLQLLVLLRRQGRAL